MSLMYEYNEQRLKAAGEPAPEFNLPDQHGDRVTLKKLLSDGLAILYFYSHDGAPGMTDELHDLNSYREKFKSLGAKVAAISTDDAESHASYAAENEISIPLLADPDQEISRQYGVVSEAGVNRRTTFVINRDREIIRVFASRRMTNHIEEVYHNLKRPSVN